MRLMRRLAAVFAFLSLGHSVALSTAMLCSGAEAGGAAMPPMAGMLRMPDGDAQRPERPPPKHGRNHDGAHCPLMASCAAMAVRASSIEMPTLRLRLVGLPAARIATPESYEPAPEPPPPKS
jgi:hypothetical protein